MGRHVRVSASHVATVARRASRVRVLHATHDATATATETERCWLLAFFFLPFA